MDKWLITVTNTKKFWRIFFLKWPGVNRQPQDRMKNGISITGFLVTLFVPRQKYKHFLGYGKSNYKLLLKNQSDETTLILTSPNAGGSSVKNEAYAFEWLYRYKNARTIVTENDVVYFNPHWKKVDFVTKINNRNYGVSVTRILPFKTEELDNLEDFIVKLLFKKLNGLVIARSGVHTDHSFESSILFAWVPSKEVEKLTQNVFKKSEYIFDGIDLVTLIAPRNYLLKDFR